MPPLFLIIISAIALAILLILIFMEPFRVYGINYWRNYWFLMPGFHPVSPYYNPNL